MSLPILDEPVVPPALVQAWRDACENQAQARQAYAKFSVRRGARRPVTLIAVAGWIIAGMLLSVGSLYAASAAPWPSLGLESTPGVLEARPTKIPRSADRHTKPKLSASPAVAIAPSPSPPTSVVGGKAPALAPGASAEATIGAPEQWQRAARGLREGDFAGANAALRALTNQTSGAEREAALLALAQLLLGHQQSAEALPLLRALQASARSSSVRRKASELLSRREESGAAERSFEGSVETHQP
jgi:hypothetical protein